jgi:hypothetical protein
LKLLSRNLSHAIVAGVVLVLGVYVAPADLGTLKARVLSAGHPLVVDAGATATVPVAHDPALLAVGGCEAPDPITGQLSLAQTLSLEDGVRLSMAGCAATIEALNAQLNALNQEISQNGKLIEEDRTILRGLARDLYRQPSSVLDALIKSGNLGDFITGISDEQSAASRAKTISDQLNRRQAQLESDRFTLQKDTAQQVTVRSALEASLSELQQLEAQQRAALVRGAVRGDPAAQADIIAIIRAAFSPLGDSGTTWALRIARCESGYNPDAVNSSSGSEGLFQFMPSTWAETPWAASSPFDPSANAAAAEWLYSRDGPGPWECK